MNLEDVLGTCVPRETDDRLRCFQRLLLDGNRQQNLISRGSEEEIWSRHLLDSAQLLKFAPADCKWLDIGSGPGLPGLVLAILGVEHITLVEPRRLRTDFLSQCVDKLTLPNVTVITGKVEQVHGRFDVITARAVARLEGLFSMAERLMAPAGHWVLPKGRSAAKELEEARATWQGRFRLEPSVTDADARIVVATGVRRKAGRG